MAVVGGPGVRSGEYTTCTHSAYISVPPAHIICVSLLPRRDQEGFTGRVQGHSTGITASRSAEVYEWLLAQPPLPG